MRILFLLAGCPKVSPVSQPRTDIYLYEPGLESLSLGRIIMPTFGSTFLLQDARDTDQVSEVVALVVAIMQACDSSYENGCVPYAIVRYDTTATSDSGYSFHRAAALFEAEVQAIVPNQSVILNEVDRLEHRGIDGPGYILFGVVITNRQQNR